MILSRGRRFRLSAWLTAACGFCLVALRGAPPVPPTLPAVTFHGQTYLTRQVDPRKEDLRLFWQDGRGGVLRDFATLDQYAQSLGLKVLFAANAGMFEPTLKPVGLLVQDGTEESPLNLNDGTGNFYMKPNGVFVINEKHEALIVESSNYASLLTPVLWATQSGPMLVHGGDIHPDFIEDSKSKKLRSGVGVTAEGLVIFAISVKPVTFYDFAELFRTHFKCPNALFLDGEISAFHVPGLNDPMPHTFGPMFGLVEKAP